MQVGTKWSPTFCHCQRLSNQKTSFQKMRRRTQHDCKFLHPPLSSFDIDIQQRRSFASTSRNNKEEAAAPKLNLKDEVLPCHEHLDPDGNILGKSEWIHANGTLPICSVEEVIEAFETHVLREAERWGIIDFEAPWNQVQEASVPTLFIVGSLADRGLSTGSGSSACCHFSLWSSEWMVSQISQPIFCQCCLATGSAEHFHMSWNVVQVSEHHYDHVSEQEQDWANCRQ